MKRILMIMMLAIASMGVSAQFVAPQKALHDSTTTLTYTDSESITHPLYVGSNKALYYITRSSRSGQLYRRYLRKDIYADSKEYAMMLSSKGL